MRKLIATFIGKNKNFKAYLQKEREFQAYLEGIRNGKIINLEIYRIKKKTASAAKMEKGKPFRPIIA